MSNSAIYDLTSYSMQIFGTVSSINSLFVPHGLHIKLKTSSGIDMVRMRKVMSKLRAIKKPDYQRAMSDLVKRNIIPNLPRDVGFNFKISHILFYFKM